MPNPGDPPGDATEASQLTVSSLIISWNSLALLKSCIESLRKQTVRPEQVVVVDNGSTDGSVEWLREQPDLEVIESMTNLGFAAANNLGFRACRQSAVLCLNADVVLHPGYIESCLQHLEHPDVGSVTGKLLRASPVGTIDSTGHAVYGIGWAENRGEELPDGGFDSAGEVFGICAASGLYRMAALRSVAVEGEVFDEIYFSYIEDVDLDWRLRWMGWRTWYEPDAVAIHHRSASGARTSARIMRHILKNRILTVVKNYDGRTLVKNLRGVAIFTLAKTLDFSRVHPTAASGGGAEAAVVASPPHRRASAGRRLAVAVPLACPRRAPGVSLEVASQFDYYEFMGYSRGVLLDRYEPYAARFEPGQSALDVGCERGEFLELLARRGVTGVGVDADGDMVRLTRARGFEVEQGVAPEYLLGHPAEFDGIFAAHVIEHLPAESVRALVTASAVALRTGGRLLLVKAQPAQPLDAYPRVLDRPVARALLHPGNRSLDLARKWLSRYRPW